jgi:hypothetical protein
MVSKMHSSATLCGRGKSERGSTLVLALLSVAILLTLGGYAMRLAGQRLATVSQAAAWQRSFYLAESGVDIARATLKTASIDPTVWATQKFSNGAGVTASWSPTDPGTFPKTCTITMPVTPEDNALVSTIALTIDRPTGAGTINPAGLGSNPAYRVRSMGNVEIPGPVRVSHDKVENNLRKLAWRRDARTGLKVSEGDSMGGPHATRVVEAVLRSTSPFVAALVAQESIELKKGKNKLVDSWNSQDADAGQRKYIVPGSDKWKGARDVGNIAANGISSDKKGKPLKDVIRVENSIIWGDIYSGDIAGVKIKPVPNPITNVVKGGDIVDDFYMKLDMVPSPATSASWGVLSGNFKVSPGSATTALRIPTGSDPNNRPKVKFTELHLHSGDTVVFTPSVDGSGVVQPQSYVDIWVNQSLRVHKGGQILLGNGVNARIFVDRCMHIEADSKYVGGIQFADFEISGAGKLVLDKGNPKYSVLKVHDAQDKQKASASQLQIYGTLANKKKKSHAKISAEFLGAIYAPRHDIQMKYKDSTYADLFGSFVGRKFKIEGTSRIHYDEALSSAGFATDFAIASFVEDWTDKSTK